MCRMKLLEMLWSSNTATLQHSLINESKRGKSLRRVKNTLFLRIYLCSLKILQDFNIRTLLKVAQGNYFLSNMYPRKTDFCTKGKRLSFSPDFSISNLNFF